MRVWIEGPTDPDVRAAVTDGGGVFVGAAEADVGVVDLRVRGAVVRSAGAPVLAIGPPDGEDLVREALQAGAQDFVLAPFRPEELLLRLRRIARPAPAGPPFQAGPVAIDLAGAAVTGPYGTRSLTGIEVRLLARLRDAGGAAVRPEELLRTVWRYHPDVVSRTVVVTIQRLRTKLEPDPARPTVLQTVRGGGYRLAVDALERDPDLIGRAGDRARLAEALAEGLAPVLVGPPGVGKSRLARAVLGEPLVVVSLADASDRAAVERQLAVALDLPGGTEPERAWRAAAHRGVAVLFDAAEGCVDGAMAVLELGGEVRRRAMTSRVAPGRGAIHEVRPLSEADARLLFERRAPDAPRDHPAVPSVLARLGGLPLAIELAAGRSALLGMSGLDAALARGFAAVAGDSDDPRARSLGGCIGASFALLTADQREVLALLACFARSPRVVHLCTAARALAADPEAALDGLRRASLVEVTPDPSGFARVAVLGAVGDAAVRGLVGPPHLAAWSRAVVDRGAALDDAAAVEARELLPEVVALVARSAAAPVLPEVSGPEPRLAAILAVATPLAMVGDPRELLALVREAATLASRTGDSRAAARAALLIGSSLDRLGADEALTARKAAVDAAIAAGAPDLEAAAWVGLAQSLRDQEPAAALEACARCREAADRARSRHHEGEGRLVEAQVLAHLGRVDDAVAAAEAACVAFAEGSRAHAGRALGQLAVALRRAGRLAEAMAAGRAALARLEQVGDDHNAEIVLGNLGNHLAEDGRTGDALPLLRRALASAQTRGHRTSAAFHQVNLGTLLAREGLSDEALAMLLDARLGFRAGGVPRGEAHAHLRSGVVRQAADRPSEAQLHYEAALHLAEAHGLLEQGAEARLRLCMVAVALGDQDLARSWWERAEVAGIPAPLAGLRDDAAGWRDHGAPDDRAEQLLRRL